LRRGEAVAFVARSQSVPTQHVIVFSRSFSGDRDDPEEHDDLRNERQTPQDVDESEKLAPVLAHAENRTTAIDWSSWRRSGRSGIYPTGLGSRFVQRR
jgi:hypothetical protein